MEFVKLEDQPDNIEIGEADGIWIKQMLLKKAGSYVPQHSHKYDHVSFISVGSVRVWCDGVLIGDLKAPKSIVIGAHTKHLFLTLEDNTIIDCIHNVSRTGVVEIHEEHQIV